MDGLSDGESQAVARLGAVLELLPAALDREVAASGLTAFEVRVLAALRDADLGRLRLSVLAARTHASLPRLSRVVTGLERAGLVTRVACDDDGRATNALLTEAGRRAYERGRPRYVAGMRRLVLDALGDGDADRLAASLDGILAALDAPRPPVEESADTPLWG